MKISYRVVPLPSEVAASARRAAEAGAPDHAVISVTSPNEAPCRHCLRWTRPGEQVVLFPYASIAHGRPYAESGPIFVHAAPCERYQAIDEFPAAFRQGRVIRAYDREQNMIAGEIVNGREPETVIEKLFENPETEFIQVRSADRGCYTFGIARA
jgi:uncharacterized protein DUF1203